MARNLLNRLLASLAVGLFAGLLALLAILALLTAPVLAQSSQTLTYRGANVSTGQPKRNPDAGSGLNIFSMRDQLRGDSVNHRQAYWHGNRVGVDRNGDGLPDQTGTGRGGDGQGHGTAADDEAFNQRKGRWFWLDQGQKGSYDAKSWWD